MFVKLGFLQIYNFIVSVPFILYYVVLSAVCILNAEVSKFHAESDSCYWPMKMVYTVR